MFSNMKHTLKITSVLESILAFLMVLECNTVYQRMTSIHLRLDWACILVVLLLVFTSKISRIGRKNIVYVGILLSFLSLYLILTLSKSNITSFISLFILLFPMLLIYLNGKKDIRRIFTIYEKISTIIIYLTALSTIVWASSEIFHLMQPNISLRISWGTERIVNGVLGLFFQCQRDTSFGFGTFYRNSGIFCEAPMFSLVISFALIYELFIRKTKGKARIIVLCIGILSTVTSSGIIMLGVCIALQYWRQIRYKRTKIRILYISSVIIIIPLAYYLFRELFEAKSSTGSYSIRMLDYYIGFETFLNSPITGSGFNNLANLIQNKTSLILRFGLNVTDSGFSNSISAVLGQGGLFLFVIYLYPYIRAFWIKIRVDHIDYHSWIISFLVLFTIAIFYAKCLMIYFLALAYAFIYIANSPGSSQKI